MTETSNPTATAPVEEERAVRLCTKCGRELVGPPRWRVHEECLSTPAQVNLRKRVREQGLLMFKKNQHAKFERILDAAPNHLLSHLAEQHSDAIISSGETTEESGQPGTKKFREYIAGAVAMHIYETSDDPKTAKKSA